MNNVHVHGQVAVKGLLERERPLLLLNRDPLHLGQRLDGIVSP
jgi:hypothetical protein